MVRTYRRVTSRAAYGQDVLNACLEQIKSKNMSLNRAHKIYRIPKATLSSHLAGKRKVKSQTQGRPPVLSHREEEELANCLKTMERWGFGLSRKEVLLIVGSYVKENNIATPFKNGIPGQDWFLAFKKRHKLSIKKPQVLEYSRTKICDPFVIFEYFDLLKQIMDEHNLHDTEEFLEVSNRPSTNFQNLLLDTIKQSAPVTTGRKKRVSRGAEIITKLQIEKEMLPPPQKKSKQVKSKRRDGSSSESGASDVTYQESSNDSNFVGDIQDDENIPTAMGVGSFCIIKFTLRKIAKFYVAEILKQHEDGFEVKFLRKKTGNKFCFPQADDIHDIKERDIEKILPKPRIDHWGKFYFDIDFSGYNLA